MIANRISHLLECHGHASLSTWHCVGDQYPAVIEELFIFPSDRVNKTTKSSIKLDFYARVPRILDDNDFLTFSYDLFVFRTFDFHKTCTAPRSSIRVTYEKFNFNSPTIAEKR